MQKAYNPIIYIHNQTNNLHRNRLTTATMLVMWVIQVRSYLVRSLRCYLD